MPKPRWLDQREQHLWRSWLRLNQDLTSVLEDEINRGGPFLFDLAVDPSEARNLADQRPAELTRLSAELEAARARLELPKLGQDGGRPSAPAPEPDAATKQRLCELGYEKC